MIIKICTRSIVCGSVLLLGCTPPSRPTFAVPSREYMQRLKGEYAAANVEYTGKGVLGSQAADVPAFSPTARARAQIDAGQVNYMGSIQDPPTVQLAAGSLSSGGEFSVSPSTRGNVRDYTGPLSLGDPGVSASLWRESRGGNDLVRDDRAWQPMDLITIVVTEKSEGKKEADTEIKEKTTVEATLEKLFGLETSFQDRNSQVDFSQPLISGGTTNDFKGEGETQRKGSLTARISAMVAEVLPSGILRIEGEKIIAVNSEEQIMVISGLVRPRDVNSENEVDSSKIANMRIDYYGQGTVGEAQDGGWLSRAMRRLWPF